MPNHFDACLKTYKIDDFDRQIRQYPETYRSFVEGKLMPRAEFELSMREGFYFGHPEAGLGEFLSFSALPRLLKEAYPGSKVFVGPNRFSQAVFAENKFVDGVRELPGRKPFGSQREFGFGTTSNRRLLPMGVFTSTPLGPEMSVSADALERARAVRAGFDLRGRKLVFIQSSGRTNPKVFSFVKWVSWLRALRDEFCIVQIGNLRDQFIWAEKVLLKQWNIEDMAALLSLGDAFVGPNSGVMHLASAVGTRTVVLHNEALASETALPCLGDNEALPGAVNHHLFHCYPWHYHLTIERLFDLGEGPAADAFTEKATLENLRTQLRSACVQENPNWTSMKSHFADAPRLLLKI